MSTMTMTDTGIEITTDQNAIYVLDRAGLDSLPAGTLLIENFDNTTVKKLDTGNFAEVGYPTSNFQPQAVFLPARVANPSVLGKFLRVLQVGDVVEIVNGWSNWPGTQGTVIQLDGYRPYIKPSKQRPDGFGLSPFYWDEQDVALVRSAAEEEARKAQPTEVGQRVEFVCADGTKGKADLGDLGAVVRIDSGYQTNLVTVKLDRPRSDREEVTVYAYRLKVTEEPRPLIVGDTITSDVELDSLTKGSVVVIEEDNDKPYTRLRDDEWARPNMFARAGDFKRVAAGELHINGAIYYDERAYLVTIIKGGALAVKVVHIG